MSKVVHTAQGFIEELNKYENVRLFTSSVPTPLIHEEHVVLSFSRDSKGKQSLALWHMPCSLDVALEYSQPVEVVRFETL